jgi:VIT1/CCC1 family predicted Fe2+/Mn2+ transporter
MTIASFLPRLKKSFVESAGTIVFGMEDGTVSIFGLVFGVAATTSSSVAVLVAGASGAAAAAVSMMAGAYLDAETSRDELAAREGYLGADRRARVGVKTACGCEANTAIVQRSPRRGKARS